MLVARQIYKVGAMLSAEQVKQFQVLYERRFGRQISERQAYDMGMKLVTLFKLTCTAQGKAQKKRNEGNQHDKETNSEEL